MRKLLEAASLLPAMILFVPSGAALGAPATASAVTVSDAWFRFLPAGLPAGGYFTIRNDGKKDLAITGAQSKACGMLMLHQSTDKGGMSGMNMVDTVPLPAGKSVRFATGGFHLMCEQAKMKVGAKVPVVITLSDGTSVAADFAVRNAAGK